MQPSTVIMGADGCIRTSEDLEVLEDDQLEEAGLSKEFRSRIGEVRQQQQNSAA